MHLFQLLDVSSGSVGIHWFGQSSFALKSPDGTILQVDPYFPRERPPDRFIHSEPPLDEATLATDYVLLTHNHRDHTWAASCQRIHAAFPECLFVGPPESIANLQENGIPSAQLRAITAGDSVTLGDIQAHVVWAKPPAGAPEDDIASPDVQHLGFVVDIGGVRVYISGDPINTFAEHDELIQPIADLAPQIGLLTNHPTEGEFPFFDGSVKMARRMGLQTAVPAHYQCFVKRNYDPQAWAAEFADGGLETLIIPYNESVVYTPAS